VERTTRPGFEPPPGRHPARGAALRRAAAEPAGPEKLTLAISAVVAAGRRRPPDEGRRFTGSPRLLEAVDDGPRRRWRPAQPQKSGGSERFAGDAIAARGSSPSTAVRGPLPKPQGYPCRPGGVGPSCLAGRTGAGRRRSRPPSKRHGPIARDLFRRLGSRSSAGRPSVAPESDAKRR